MVAIALFTNPNFTPPIHLRPTGLIDQTAVLATITTAVIYYFKSYRRRMRHLGAGLAIPISASRLALATAIFSLAIAVTSPIDAARSWFSILILCTVAARLYHLFAAGKH